MKTKAYILVCVNERGLVSLNMFSTREAAQKAMFKAYDNELENAAIEGYGIDSIHVATGPLDASVKYGECSYDWTVQFVHFNPEDYK